MAFFNTSFHHSEHRRSSLQRLKWDLILDHDSFRFSTLRGSSKESCEIAGLFDDFSRDFLRSFRSFIRSVLRYGHPASGDPGLRYGLRSLRSYISLRKLSSKSSKILDLTTFFEIPSVEKRKNRISYIRSPMKQKIGISRVYPTK